MATTAVRPRHGNVDISRTRARASDGQPTKQMQMALVVKILFFVNLFVVVALFVSQGELEGLTAPGANAVAAGRLSGLIGLNLILVQLLLMGRNAFLNRLFGLDRLARWHRVIGHTSFDFIVAHVTLIIIGYMQMLHLSVARIPNLILQTRDILMATVAFVMLVLVVVTSIRAARRAMRYESWFYIHLYVYLAIALSIPHEIFDGHDFIGHPVTQVYWGTFYVLAIGTLVFFRVVTPLYSFGKYDLRVADVVEENHEVVSIYLEGRNLEDLRAQSGQFFIWRFLCSGQWWQAHPYSLSAAPPSEMPPNMARDWLRITVKDLGRGSGELLNVPIGARVIAEGPFGVFTAARRLNRRVLLIAGGIGITPIRSLLEGLPARKGDITLIYRATSEEDLIFMDELEELARLRSAELILVMGSRKEYPARAQPLGPKHLRTLVPDLPHRDVYVCGPEAMTHRVLKALKYVGLKETQIHYESFAF